MSKFIEMQLFVTVVEAGSMAEAARRLGAAKSMISQRMTNLEQRLGVSLLERGRYLRLTEAGRIFYDHCLQILARITEAEDAVASNKARLQGLLRITVPQAFSIRYLAPILAKFCQLYPDLQLDIEGDDRYANLSDTNFDLAIRMGQLADSSLLARTIAPNTHLICASPVYLEQRGTPLKPDELQNHDGLLYINREHHGMWQLPVKGSLRSYRIGSRLRTDNGHQLLEAAKSGLGLAILPSFLAADAIAAGALKIVLPEYSPDGGHISAVYRQSQRASPKIHALVNFLIEQIGRPTSWDQSIQPFLPATSKGRS